MNYSLRWGEKMAVHEIKHPLIRHKLGLMRKADLSTKNFREMSQEIAALLTYEATKDLPLMAEEVQGWCGSVAVERLAGKKVTVVPILRAERKSTRLNSTHVAHTYS